MSELKIAFTLSDKDVAFLRKLIRHTAARAKDQDSASITAAAAELAQRLRDAKPPRYVLDQVAKLEQIIAIAEDKDWALPAKTRQRVLTALAYFSSPHDLIPDRIPGLGYLDDAIIVELVARDLKAELKGHAEYQRFKQGGVHRPWVPSAELKLADKKKALRTRIAAEDAKAPKHGFWLW